jgi:succinate dehydrogenase hydrophobic anchor subunit
MISLIPLSIFILGIVMFFDKDASFAQCFRGLALVVVAVILFAGIGLSQIANDNSECATQIVRR